MIKAKETIELAKQLSLALYSLNPVWVCNVQKKFADKQLKVFATDTRFDWTIGKPRDTYAYTEQQLMEKDIVGIYATRKRDTTAR